MKKVLLIITLITLLLACNTKQEPITKTICNRYHTRQLCVFNTKPFSVFPIDTLYFLIATDGTLTETSKYAYNNVCNGDSWISSDWK